MHKADAQTIAGVTASCYRLNQTTSQSTYCFDPKTGMLLLVDGTTTSNGKPATTTMRATQASASVESIDLNPPYKVQAEPTPTPK